jgi:hypothetical protein
MVRVVILVSRQGFYVQWNELTSYMKLNALLWSRVVLGDAASVGRLVEARRTALRCGVWFRVLNRTERAILDLTVRCVDRIRSARLAKVVMAILIKLKLAMESVVERMTRVVGRSLALKVSNIAVSWGNLSASQWSANSAFARYLAITQINTPRLFQV